MLKAQVNSSRDMGKIKTEKVPQFHKAKDSVYHYRVANYQAYMK